MKFRFINPTPRVFFKYKAAPITPNANSTIKYTLEIIVALPVDISFVIPLIIKDKNYLKMYNNCGPNRTRGHGNKPRPRPTINAKAPAVNCRALSQKRADINMASPSPNRRKKLASTTPRMANSSASAGTTTRPIIYIKDPKRRRAFATLAPKDVYQTHSLPKQTVWQCSLTCAPQALPAPA